jgi:hypothetical protein
MNRQHTLATGSEPLLDEPAKLTKEEIRKSRRVNSSYYAASHAAEIMPVLAEIMRDGKARFFNYSVFGLSKSSLQIKILQSWLWLIDHADPDKKYAELRTKCFVRPEAEGIRIGFKSRFGAAGRSPSTVDEGVSWRAKLDEFLEKAQPKDILTMSNLTLTVSDIQEFSMRMEELKPHFMGMASGTEIQVLRI